MLKIQKKLFYSYIKSFYSFALSCSLFILTINAVTKGNLHLNNKISLISFIKSYCYNCSIFLDFIIPLSLSITIINIIKSMKNNGELLTLLSCGFSKKQIIKPFFYAICIINSLLYLNYELLYPRAFEYIKHKNTTQILSMKLDPSTIFIANDFDPLTTSFYDAYLIKDNQLIYKMDSFIKRLGTQDSFIGYNIDIFEKKNNWEYSSHQDSITINNLNLNTSMIQSISQELEGFRLSLITKTVLFKHNNTWLSCNPALKSEFKANFYKKTLQPINYILISLISLFTAINLSNQRSITNLYFRSILNIMVLFITTNVLFTVSKLNIINPTIFMGLPTIILMVGLYIKTLKLKIY